MLCGSLVTAGGLQTLTVTLLLSTQHDVPCALWTRAKYVVSVAGEAS
jgi:hypothetical protein